jgi:hypothetical protein
VIQYPVSLLVCWLPDLGATENSSGTRLHDGYKMKRRQNALVLETIRVRESPLICLFGKFIDSLLSLRIGPKRGNLRRCPSSQALSERLNQTIKNGATHINIIPHRDVLDAR